MNVARRYLIRHPRSPLARWARRLIGVAATAVVLGVGVLIASMLLSIHDDTDPTPFPAALPTRATGPHTHKEHERTKERRAEPGT